jgi:hypothetical protein
MSRKLGFDCPSTTIPPRILTPSLPIAAAYIASHVHIKIALLGRSCRRAPGAAMSG